MSDPPNPPIQAVAPPHPKRPTKAGGTEKPIDNSGRAERGLRAHPIDQKQDKG